MNRLLRQVLISYLPKISVFICMPVLTKILTNALTKSEYGAYSLIASLSNYAIFLAGFGIHRYLAREVPGRTSLQQHGAFFRVLKVEALLFVVVAAAFSLALPLFLASAMDILPYWRIAVMFIWASATYLLYNEIIRFFGFQRRFEVKSALAFVDRPLFAIAVGLEIWIIGSLTVNAVVTSLVVVYAALLALTLPFIRWRYVKVAGARSQPHVVLLAAGLVPLFLVDLFTKTKDLLPRYLIAGFSGRETAGLYAFSDNCAHVFFLLVSSLVFVFYPYIAASYRSWRNGDEGGESAFLRGLKASTGLSVYLFIAAATVGYVYRSRIVLLLSNEKYLGAVDIMPGLLVGYLLLIPVCILQPIVILMTPVRKLWPAYLSMLVLNVAAAYLLVRFFGTNGAVAAIIATNALWLAVVTIFARRQVRQSLTAIAVLRFVAFSALSAGIVYSASRAIANPWASMAAATVLATALFAAFEIRHIRYLILHKE